MTWPPPPTASTKKKREQQLAQQRQMAPIRREILAEDRIGPEDFAAIRQRLGMRPKTEDGQ